MFVRKKLGTRRRPFPFACGLLILIVSFVTFVAFLFVKLNVDEKSLVELYGESTILSWPYPLTTSEDSVKAVTTRARRRESRIPASEKQNRLRETFPAIDVNDDKLLTIKEISTWISSQVKQHMQKAVRENIHVFTSVDSNPRNGVVSWDEYHRWFLKEQGLNETYLEEHNEKHSELRRTLKEKIAWDQAAWQEAARTDPKFLNLDEFLGFRHPESSHTNLLHKVEGILSDFDENFDEELDWDEFSAMPDSNSMIPLSQYLSESQLEKKKRNEFKHFLDKNGDGALDQRELISYVNPSNSRHSELEAEILVQLSDKTGDSQLDLNEVLNAADYFFASKVFDVGEKFHREF